MNKLSAEEIVELFEKDIRSRKRLAELLIAEPDVRLAIINAVIKDVATKEDIARLETRINNLEARISSLEGRVSRLEGQMNLFIKLFIAFNLPILLGIIGMLLKLVFM